MVHIMYYTVYTIDTLHTKLATHYTLHNSGV